MEEVAGKMKHMVGVGPIQVSSVKFFQNKDTDENGARIKAVREYLACYLEFDDEELEQIEIIETKVCKSRNDILYVVFKDQVHVREVHYRRAVSGNDNLIVRDFIPPQFFARHMAIGKKATEKRALGQHSQDTN